MNAGPAAARTGADGGVADAMHAALDAGLAATRPGALTAIAIAAPLAAPAAVLGAAPARTDAAVWEPPRGAGARGAGDAERGAIDPVAFATAGVAAVATGAGEARFAQVIAAARAAYARLVRVGDADAPAPRFVGGLAFAPGAADGDAWRGFGDARFVLPRWTYARRGDAAWLVAVVDGDARAPATRDGWHGELAELRAAFAAGPAAAGAPVVRVAEDDAATWRHHIAEIRAAIAGGAAAKIVAARACEVELAAPADPAAVLRRLGERQPECTRFAIRLADRGADRVTDRVFVGASPERLVAVRGDAVACDALAGSIARGADAAADAVATARLIASAKDREEHDLVTRMITTALAPACARLDAPATPAVRTLRNIHHLHTPVRGVLAAPRHVLELAAALHPTPAVAGVPTTVALAWIAAREPTPRGWYAAPVGWFDADGDGELAVAIRSGLVAGRRATLFVGAGIVGASDADAELDETRVKLRALLGALEAGA